MTSLSVATQEAAFKANASPIFEQRPVVMIPHRGTGPRGSARTGEGKEPL